MLGVKPAGFSAAAADQILAESVVDDVVDKLQQRGLAPFSSSSVPDYARIEIAKCVAWELVGHFGIRGEGLMLARSRKDDAERERVSQLASEHPGVVPENEYF